MTRKLMTGAVLALALFAMPLAQDRGEIALRAAMETETVKGDLRTAIEAYRRIINDTANDRAVRATAMLRMAACYGRLGSREAGWVYQQVVREFPEQLEIVGQARAALAQHSPASRPAPTIREITTGLWPTLSGDGRFIARVDSAGTTVLIRSLASGQERRVLLTDGGAGRANNPVLSPDGHQLAYRWLFQEPGRTRRNALRIASLTGERGTSRAVPLGDDIEWFAVGGWSPQGDGLSLAVRRTDRSTWIAVLSLQDGVLHPVVQIAEMPGNARIPFSPDGVHLAFSQPDVANRRPEHDVLIATIATGAIQIVTHPSHDLVAGWTPDGQVLFSSNRVGGFGLYALDLDAAGVAGDTRLVRNDVNAVRPVGITLSGALVYASPSGGGPDISVVDVDLTQGTTTGPARAVVPEYAGTNSQPDFSPDGKSLAYVSRRPGSVGSAIIGILNLESGRARELRPELAIANGLRWSPDSSFLVVTGSDFSGQRGLFRVDAQSGDASLLALTTDPATNAVRWHPDGRSLFFRRIEYPNYTIVRLDLETGGQTDIVTGGLPAGTPSVSPDGRKLYYRRALPGGSDTPEVQFSPTGEADPAVLIQRDLVTGAERELLRDRFKAFTMSPDGRYLGVGRRRIDLTTGDVAERPKVDPDLGGSWGIWTPDSRSTVSVRQSKPEGPYELWWRPIDGRQPRRLMEGPLVVNGLSSIHPSGRQIAVTVRPTNPQWRVHIIENFLPGTASSPNR